MCIPGFPGAGFVPHFCSIKLVLCEPSHLKASRISLHLVEVISNEIYGFFPTSLARRPSPPPRGLAVVVEASMGHRQYTLRDSNARRAVEKATKLAAKRRPFAGFSHPTYAEPRRATKHAGMIQSCRARETNRTTARMLYISHCHLRMPNPIEMLCTFAHPVQHGIRTHDLRRSGLGAKPTGVLFSVHPTGPVAGCTVHWRLRSRAEVDLDQDGRPIRACDSTAFRRGHAAFLLHAHSDIASLPPSCAVRER